MDIDALKQQVLSAPGREIHGSFADGRRCVIAFDGELWCGWGYEGHEIMYDYHWYGQDIDELIVNGRAKGYDVLKANYRENI